MIDEQHSTAAKQAVGRNVREWRHERGMTQAQLAEAIGVSGRPYICEVEKGRNCPSLPALYAIAVALKVQPWELLA